MKILRIVLLASIILFAHNAVINAQTAAKAGKAVKELVKKGAKSASKTKPKSNYTHSTPKAKPRARVTTVKCNTCKGTGQVNIWNQYYGWQTQTCATCNGLGRVRSN